MSLNNSKIRNLKPSLKPSKVSDSHGLYLLVNPGGSRLWYLIYRFNQKESHIALGAYPLVSLAEASTDSRLFRCSPGQHRGHCRKWGTGMIGIIITHLRHKSGSPHPRHILAFNIIQCVTALFQSHQRQGVTFHR